MIEQIIDAIVNQIDRDTLATMLIFIITSRAAWGLTDILIDGLRMWVSKQLSDDE